MAVHFTYDDKPLPSDLRQGDILNRSAQLDKLLQSFYPQYAAKLENRYFLVLTQSCDLVRRGGRQCDTRYISLAPVRPLDVAVRRKLEEFIEAEVAPGLPVCTEKNRARLQNWMERLLNNNEPNYFFLRKEPTKGIAEDSCAFLALSIAIKSELHYQTCLDARILALEGTFQAKLGWLVGQMYSRIGTEDWPASDLQEEIKNVLKDVSIWIDQRKVKPLRKLVREWQTAHPGQQMDEATLTALIARVPRKKDELVSRLIAVLRTKELVTEATLSTATNLIRNDPVISQLLPD
jgi:hypothetical protein